jgi:hypothetical protein
MVRAELAVFGPVASDPTVSRLIDTLAAGGERALNAIRSARSHVRQHVWKLAGQTAPDATGSVTVDLDGVLVIAHSGCGTHEFVAWLAKRGRWLSYSVGMTITDAIHQAVLKVPLAAWTTAVEPDGEIRDGAWVAELTGGMQVRDLP